MSASLPVPNDIDPEEPDGHDSAPIVSLPSSPKAPSVERKAPRKKAAKGKRPTKPAPVAEEPPAEEPPAEGPPTEGPPAEEGLPDESASGDAAPAAPSAKLAELAAADIVIPPKPPLPEPAVEAEPEAEGVVEAEPEPVIEPEPVVEVAAPAPAEDVLVLRGVSKRFGDTLAVDGIDLTVPAGTFYGLVGPNGAGKTTTLSLIAGLLEPDRGTITVGGADAASDRLAAKRVMGVLPDRLRTFDRLTGRQLLHYYGVLRGLPAAVVESRTADLARAFDLSDALGRVVSDYSAGMLKKVMLAGALIHSPRLLVLDEPFEAVDPVSSAIILDILSTYVAHGGTVILSSHGMELVERVCSRVAVIVAGQVLAEGTVDEVRGELSLEQRFIELAGGLSDVEGLEWLHTFSD
ncbi:ABC transporter ATP-binding protein [Microbacterium sp. NPDC056003]|uniref:ABC transporter ATP-binding protein n=1 Tax=Microbacterium sp. NPDC056003 TaxID=3345676 RepID=UPI0035E35BA1